MEKITINGVKSSYDVILEKAILNNKITFLDDYQKVCLLLDKNVDCSLYNELLKQIREKKNIIIFTNGSEKTKSFSFYQKVLRQLIENNFNRNDAIVALGGGTTLDLAGFVCSSYKRGINLVSIPSSLLAMVDASIGSKNSINYLDNKNIIGSFYDPKLVIIDQDLLNSLPKKQFYSGLCEVLKMALLANKELFEKIEKNNFRIEELIHQSILIKKHFVEKDIYDISYRHGLNLGHSYGHAIESISNFKIAHGIAVANGLLYILDEPLKSRVQKILKKWRIKMVSYSKEQLNPYLLNDKKNENKSINFVYLKEIGCFIINGKEYYYG